MSSELLHDILINGLYSRLSVISSIITPEMNLHTYIFETDLKCYMSLREGPRETHIKKIIFGYAEGKYTVNLGLMHGEILSFPNHPTLKAAFDAAVTEFGWGRYKDLIPQN